MDNIHPSIKIPYGMNGELSKRNIDLPKGWLDQGAKDYWNNIALDHQVCRPLAFSLKARTVIAVLIVVRKNALANFCLLFDSAKTYQVAIK